MSKTEQDPVYRIIEHAGEIIKTRGWTQGHFAVDKNGDIASWSSDEACAFCLEGAVNRASKELALDDASVMCGDDGPVMCGDDGSLPAWFFAMKLLDREVASLGIDHFVRGTRVPVESMVSFNDNVAKSADAVLAVIESAKDRRAKELEDVDG